MLEKHDKHHKSETQCCFKTQCNKLKYYSEIYKYVQTVCYVMKYCSN